LLADCYFSRYEQATLGFVDRGDKASAWQIYQRILWDFPSYSNLGWIHYQIGRILLSDNRLDESVKAFQHALLAPSHISVLTAYSYERLGFIAFYERRDLNEAIAFLNRAVDTYPLSADRRWLVQLHVLRARVLRAMHDYEGAVKAGESALAVVNSGSGDNRSILTEALLILGEVLSELGERDRDVIGYLQRFLQNSKKPVGVDVTWARVNEMIGDAHFNLSQYENAVNAYYAVLRYNPDHPWVLQLYYRIACCYYQQGSYAETVQVIQSLLNLADTEDAPINDYRVFDILGNALFALKKYDGAIGAYQKAIKLVPPNQDSLRKIQTYYELARELA
jgi:tetratricopeptide (TPR) repeat protein